MPVRVHEVGDRLALGQELGVHAEAEVRARALPRAGLEGAAHRPVGRARDHRALHDHGVVAGLRAQRLADRGGRLLDVLEVDAALGRGRADGDEGHVARERPPPARSDVARSRVPTWRCEQLRQPRLVDRRAPRVDGVDLAAVDVDADRRRGRGPRGRRRSRGRRSRCRRSRPSSRGVRRGVVVVPDERAVDALLDRAPSGRSRAARAPCRSPGSAGSGCPPGSRPRRPCRARPCRA